LLQVYVVIPIVMSSVWERDFERIASDSSYNCLLTIVPHWDDVQWSWPGSKPQRSRSPESFKGQSTHARVRDITYVCIDGLPSNLVQMVSFIETMSIYPRIFRLPI